MAASERRGLTRRAFTRLLLLGSAASAQDSAGDVVEKVKEAGGKVVERVKEEFDKARGAKPPGGADAAADGSSVVADAEVAEPPADVIPPADVTSPTDSPYDSADAASDDLGGDVDAPGGATGDATEDASPDQDEDSK